MKKRLLQLFIILHVMVFTPDILLAADAVPPEMMLLTILLGKYAHLLLPLLLLASVVLKALAWFLGWVADKTKNTCDNKIVEYLHFGINLTGWAIGLFSFGNMPQTIDKPKDSFYALFKPKADGQPEQKS